MIKKFRFVFVLMMLFSSVFVLTSCDPGIYDIIDGPEDGLDFRQFLDPKTSYNQLLRDLEFMKSNCYLDEKLAGAQSMTIVLSYGLADISKDSSSLTKDQQTIKVNLYDAIRYIFAYSNVIDDYNIYTYDSQFVGFHTDRAIVYCKQFLATL